MKTHKSFQVENWEYQMEMDKRVVEDTERRKADVRGRGEERGRDAQKGNLYIIKSDGGPL